MRRDTHMQSGHAAMPDDPLAVTAMVWPSIATLSTDNPAGIKDEEERLRLMLLIPFTNQSKPTTQHHQI